MKPVRDENLVNEVREQPCVACKKPPRSEAHHITTRGAGGGDTGENLMPLCKNCHYEWHYSGISKFLWKNPHVKEWLMQKGRYDIIQKIQKTARGSQG